MPPPRRKSLRSSARSRRGVCRAGPRWKAGVFRPGRVQLPSWTFPPASQQRFAAFLPRIEQFDRVIAPFDHRARRDDPAIEGYDGTEKTRIVALGERRLLAFMEVCKLSEGRLSRRLDESARNALRRVGRKEELEQNFVAHEALLRRPHEPLA